MTEFENAIPINTVDMNNDSAQFLAYSEKNLLFALGDEDVKAIDLTC